MSGSLAAALRTHAEGGLCAGAAAELLIAGFWLDRDDFAGRFVTVTASPGSGRAVAVAGWPAETAALGAGLPCPGGERRMPGLTASLAAGTPVNLNAGELRSERGGQAPASACRERMATEVR